MVLQLLGWLSTHCKEYVHYLNLELYGFISPYKLCIWCYIFVSNWSVLSFVMLACCWSLEVELHFYILNEVKLTLILSLNEFCNNFEDVCVVINASLQSAAIYEWYWLLLGWQNNNYRGYMHRLSWIFCIYANLLVVMNVNYTPCVLYFASFNGYFCHFKALFIWT